MAQESCGPDPDKCPTGFKGQKQKKRIKGFSFKRKSKAKPSEFLKEYPEESHQEVSRLGGTDVPKPGPYTAKKKTPKSPVMKSPRFSFKKKKASY